MLIVLQLVLQVDDNIVKVGSTKVIQVVEEGIIHEPLLCCRLVYKSKGQHLVLKYAITSLESCKVFQVRVYTYPIEGLANVQFCEYLALTQVGQGFFQEGYWVMVFVGYIIQFLEVDIEL